MHKLTFFPLGNADSCLIALENGKRVLFDYDHCRDETDKGDLRIDLAQRLRDDLDSVERDYYDAVAFTHADDDHIHGAPDFFYLEHAAKYQGDDRIKINELWVPAAFILEEGLKDDAAVLRAEARHRLKKGKGIRVFSRPERLRDWLKSEGIKLEDRAHLITHAGSTIPGFTTQNDGVEFFVHSPFSKHTDQGEDIDRNECSLVVQATFKAGDESTRLLLTADTTYDIWADIVNITKANGNDERLVWDVFKIPHHCSYLSLSDEQGKDETKPVREVQWVLDQGQAGGILVATSKPIPCDDKDVQPPHRQAANCYRKCAARVSGSFVVTMEHPKVSAPDELVIEITTLGAKLCKKISAGGAAAISVRPPRAG